jgi:very-short-patch-repair endonuclease
MQGYDFHRQRPIDRYIVDFFCPALMLAIEIDGLSHRLAEGRERDLPRQQRLEALGVRFLRFSEREVLQEMPSVLQRIAEGIAWVQQLDQDQ